MERVVESRRQNQEEKALPVKCLPHKHQKLSLDPQHHVKARLGM